MAATWTTQRERGHPAALRFFVGFALRLGRPIARLLLPPIVLYFLVAGGPSGLASRRYLRRVFGRAPTFADRYRHVHCFAAALLDRLFLLGDRFDLFRIRVFGDDVMKRAMAARVDPDGVPRRGVFVIGSHLGSCEAARTPGRDESDLRVSMVMYEENARHFASVVAAIDPKLSDSVIALGRVDAMLRVKRALDDGGLVGMLADRTLGEDEGTSSARTVTLFGDPIAIPTGPFRMAAMLRRPAIFLVGLYRGGNRYDVHYEPLHDFSTLDAVPPAERGRATTAAVDAAIDAYVARLEHFCRDAPYNWFNFYDFWDDARAVRVAS